MWSRLQYLIWLVLEREVGVLRIDVVAEAPWVDEIFQRHGWQWEKEKGLTANLGQPAHRAERRMRLCRKDTNRMLREEAVCALRYFILQWFFAINIRTMSLFACCFQERSLQPDSFLVSPLVYQGCCLYTFLMSHRILPEARSAVVAAMFPFYSSQHACFLESQQDYQERVLSLPTEERGDSAHGTLALVPKARFSKICFLV